MNCTQTMIRVLLAALAVVALPGVGMAEVQAGGVDLEAALADVDFQPHASFAGVAREELRLEDYSDATLESAEHLAIQENGRVKPLRTYADFQLMKLNGRRWVEVTLPTGVERKLSAVEWLLDVWFFPEQARRYPHFLIDDKAVLTALGLEFPERKKRGRFSYAEIEPARQALFDRASEINEIEKSVRSRLEREILGLAIRVSGFEGLLVEMAFTRLALPVEATPWMAAEIAPRVDGVGDLLTVLPQLRARWDAAAAGQLDREEARAADTGRAALERAIGFAVETGGEGPGLLAPLAAVPEEDDAWRDVGQLIEGALAGDGDPDTVALVGGLERAARVKGDLRAFEEAFVGVSDLVAGRAEARGVYAKIASEVSFYNAKYFMNALVLFLVGFVVVCVDWLRPNRPARIAAWITNGAGLALLVTGITTRCLLLSRPPVATLYETILFIAAGVVFIALFIEFALRFRVGLGSAAVFGAAGMFLANKYEFREALTSGDTKGPLVAVLDTNFWLATHVTTVTFGYAASLLASGLATAWLFGKLASWVMEQRPSGKPLLSRKGFADLTRATYGVVCFGVVLSTVGTILGGIWANDSWGRFWGWDPKENGALMIVLWQLVILHSRMGGYVRQFGLNLLAIGLGPVTVFSWWHVNNLEVG
ncbi:MAG: cytochrome c biogenesis protein CcsA, partial [Planctomycetota bacterium]